ncbi:unnamed protein product [Rotaria socialis]|uniref:NAD(P)(+)--arginine ADP-ribosyltransferase n=1 Tax=Rotaria socialis TaxID=392032 RepID=A0A817USS0_9BILA|nr:unnamed protein product [Rotaria socialis]CAF3393680.1 unnamed protein product [Rotaria socialis]CAF4234071.1 unnamed protein product [Rotaria socialis]CAF4271041.1 unnamed protein product [Rotaria socialis]
MDLSVINSSPLSVQPTIVSPVVSNESEELATSPGNNSNQVERAAVHRRRNTHNRAMNRYEVSSSRGENWHSWNSLRLPYILHQLRVINEVTIDAESNNNRMLRFQDRLDCSLPTESVSNDTPYHGNIFIMDWLLQTFKTPAKVTFDRIFKLLIEGIQKEGEMHGDPNLHNLFDILWHIEQNASSLSETKRMALLREGCIYMYTEASFLYRKTNEALRVNDKLKLKTLGPFCFLLYDYIGRNSSDNVSKLDRLRQTLHFKKKNPLIVYRGDIVLAQKLKEYREAAGNDKKCFKWSCFVSTSADIDKALKFGKNVLYEMDLGRYRWNDQFANISHLSVFETENETLLQPGVRFCIDTFEENWRADRALVRIHILPSYVQKV